MRARYLLQWQVLGNIMDIVIDHVVLGNVMLRDLSSATGAAHALHVRRQAGRWPDFKSAVTTLIYATDDQLQGNFEVAAAAGRLDTWRCFSSPGGQHIAGR
jgi:hypothetical protein